MNLEQMVKRLSVIEARIDRQTILQTKQERKDDTRRKIILGSFFMYFVEQNNLDHAAMLKMLDNYLTRPHDRKLFDLE